MCGMPTRYCSRSPPIIKEFMSYRNCCWILNSKQEWNGEVKRKWSHYLRRSHAQLIQDAAECIRQFGRGLAWAVEGVWKRGLSHLTRLLIPFQLQLWFSPNYIQVLLYGLIMETTTLWLQYNKLLADGLLFHIITIFLDPGFRGWKILVTL